MNKSRKIINNKSRSNGKIIGVKMIKIKNGKNGETIKIIKINNQNRKNGKVNGIMIIQIKID